MEKTIKEHLERLPEPYRQQALNNYEAQLSNTGVGLKYKNLSLALAAAFVWNDTPAGQGWDYWSTVSDFTHALSEPEELIDGKVAVTFTCEGKPDIVVYESLYGILMCADVTDLLDRLEPPCNGVCCAGGNQAHCDCGSPYDDYEYSKIEFIKNK